MNPRLAAISRRRAELVARAEAQRAEINRLTRRWHTPLTFVDRGFALVCGLRTHPLAVAIGVALLLRIPGGRLALWIERLWTGWRLYQSVRALGAKERI
jgi:YqjK-like protein